VVVGKGAVSDALVEEFYKSVFNELAMDIIKCIQPVIAHKRLKKSLDKFREHKIVPDQITFRSQHPSYFPHRSLPVWDMMENVL
jgi:hypothetical protein